MDTSCAAFGRDVSLEANRIHRFVVGEDSEPRPLSDAEAADELGDPFATLVLLQGTFPQTASETIAAIKAAVPESDSLRRQMSFLIGEGSQVAVALPAAEVDGGVRFIITLGANADGPPDGPDVLLSVSRPDQTGIELMAWDRIRGGFNYYRSMGEPPAWVFAGNSRHALTDPTRGKGPFESHKSGALLMRELKIPWVHWDSNKASIAPTAFGPGDERVRHEWFREKQPGGAYALEFEVARPAVARWARRRFDDLLPGGSGTIDDPRRILEQIVATPAANLVSSNRESRNGGPLAPPIDLPGSFFVDTDGLRQVGLALPPAFAVPNELYQNTLSAFDVHLDDERGFSRPGDTHFAFVVPERALEDQVVLEEALKRGLLSRRLAACLLMTDFCNPIFSGRRAALLQYVPAKAIVENGASSFSEEMAAAIVAAAEELPEGTPEGEFAALWTIGEDFEEAFNARLGAYYQAVEGRLLSQEGLDDYFRLAESLRRQAVAEMPVFQEFKLLFARSNIDPQARVAMRADATVG